MNEFFSSFQPTISESGLLKFGLSLEYSKPCAALKDVVHSYLQVRTIKPTPYPVIPDGTQSIFISRYGVKIGGAQSQVRELQLFEPGEYFGIRFYPGALRFFFNLDLAEITGEFVDETYFPCKEFADIYQAIYRCENYHQRTNICEKWLLKHYNPLEKSQFDQALLLINKSFGCERVNKLADNVGRSSRHLNRLFRLHTGLNTKTFCKIIRLQHACKQIYLTSHNRSNPNLELGYFDQAHLIKDFQQYLLSTPSDYYNCFMSDFYNS